MRDAARAAVRLTFTPRDMLGCVHGLFGASVSAPLRRFNGAASGGMTAATPHRTIALVGLMGAGKTSIGRRLAQRLGLPFIDADAEIETAAGMTIPEIFERHGEAAFRDGERRVIARLLENPAHVLATGGGAFMDPATRALLRTHTLTVWLRAGLELMLARVGRRGLGNRPLLRGRDPRSVLEALMAERYPVYAEADITVDSLDAPPEATVERVLEALSRRSALAEPEAAP
jgi:shikimate kinase